MAGAEGPARPLAVVLALVVRDGRVLMIRRRHPPYTGRWCLIGGKVEPGESLTTAWRREVCEETGLEPVLEGLVGWVDEVLVADEGVLAHYHLWIGVGHLSGGLGGDTGEGEVAWVEPVDPAIAPTDRYIVQTFVGATAFRAERVVVRVRADGYWLESVESLPLGRARG